MITYLKILDNAVIIINLFDIDNYHNKSKFFIHKHINDQS